MGLSEHDLKVVKLIDKLTAMFGYIEQARNSEEINLTIFSLEKAYLMIPETTQIINELRPVLK